MPRLLDPKLDVVFKMLFADERNRSLLCSLLTAILDPAQPITEIEILNPEMPREGVLEKGAVLDVRARLLDGTQTHVEMQTVPHPGLRQRALYYWARLYTSQLLRGDAYADLVPAVSVFLLNFQELPSEQHHSVFRLLDVHEPHSPLSDNLTLHFIELPKLPAPHPAAPEPAVLRWSRFFAAKSQQELENLAMADPNLRQAKDALERLSEDPKAQELAREREIWAYFHDYGLRLARRQAEAEGRAEGLAQGRAETVLQILARRGVTLCPADADRIRTCRDMDQLKRWLDRALDIQNADELFA